MSNSESESGSEVEYQRKRAVAVQLSLIKLTQKCYRQLKVRIIANVGSIYIGRIIGKTCRNTRIE